MASNGAQEQEDAETEDEDQQVVLKQGVHATSAMRVLSRASIERVCGRLTSSFPL